jgi:hypothetical protein
VRLAVADDDLDIESLRSRLDAPDDDRLRAALRERYDVPDPLSDAEAEQALSAALDALVAGDEAAALDRLEASFTTVCERRDPETPVGTAACHRCDEASPF